TMSQTIMLAAVILLETGYLRAQGATAAISGTVMDPTGAAIPGASITIKNIGTSPTYRTVDLNLAKDTKLREATTLQFRAEFFNILNHTNFGVPTLGAFNSSGTARNSNAGTITTIVGTSRQIQFALKLLF